MDTLLSIIKGIGQGRVRSFPIPFRRQQSNELAINDFRYGADIHLRQNLENYLATQGIRGRKASIQSKWMKMGKSLGASSLHSHGRRRYDFEGRV